MKHVRKQDWMGCAVATAAMLADLSYEEVAAWPSLPSLARTRWPQEMCTLLESVTECKWQVTTLWPRRPMLAHFSFPQWPVAVFLQDAPFYPRRGQWVVVKRNLVHDPGEKTVHVANKYPRREWRIASLAEPQQPVAFVEDQARRCINRIHQVLQREGLL